MAKKILIYGLGIFFSKIIVFLLIPIYTRCFSTTDYGYYDVLVTNLTMLVSIAFIEVWSGTLRFMFDYENPYKPIKAVIKIIPFLGIFYFIGILILSFIMDIKYPIVTVLFGLSYFLFTIYNSICRGLQKNVDYIISGVISATFSSVLSIICVVLLKKGIVYVLISQTLGYLLASLYVEIRTKALRYSLCEKAETVVSKEVVKYCFPLMINSFSFLFLGTYNKNYILKVLGESASGYYAFILKFSSILSIIISIFTLSWQEVAFQNSNSEDRAKKYTYYLNGFIKIVGLSIPLYCIFLYKACPIIGGKQYIESVQYIPLSILATFIAEFSGILSILIAVNKKTTPILISTVVGAIVNVILMQITVNCLGINAASLSLLIAYIFIGTIRYLCGKKHTGAIIKPRNFLIMCIEMLCVIITYNIQNDVILYILFCFCLIIAFVINKDTIIIALNKIKKGKNIL